jgi:hypothetical protein
MRTACRGTVAAPRRVPTYFLGVAMKTAARRARRIERGCVAERKSAPGRGSLAASPAGSAGKEARRIGTLTRGERETGPRRPSFPRSCRPSAGKVRQGESTARAEGRVCVNYGSAFPSRCTTRGADFLSSFWSGLGDAFISQPSRRRGRQRTAAGGRFPLRRGLTLDSPCPTEVRWRRSGEARFGSRGGDLRDEARA